MTKHLPHRRHHHHTLMAGVVHPFHPHRHNAVWLSQKIVTFARLRTDGLARLQKLALHKFQSDQIYNLNDDVTEYRTKEVIAAYFSLFDELFFFGTLTDVCSVVIDHGEGEGGKEGDIEFLDLNPKKASLVAKLKGLGRRSVVPSVPPPDLDAKPMDIVLYKHHTSSERRYERLRLLLGTLLHLMLHAFFHIWSCDYRDCYNGSESVGRGHGEAWQDAAAAIEEAVKDGRYLNLDVSLERENGLVVELERTGKESRRELKDWGMSEDGIEKLRRKRRRLGWCELDTRQH